MYFISITDLLLIRCQQKSCMGYSRQLWRRCWVMNFWPTDEVQNFQRNYFHCQHLTSSKKVFGLQSGGRGWDIAATLRTSHPRFFGHLLMLVLFSLPVLSISRMPNPGVYPVNRRLHLAGNTPRLPHSLRPMVLSLPLLIVSWQNLTWGAFSIPKAEPFCSSCSLYIHF